MSTEHDINNIELNSCEISQLWATYMSNSMVRCVASYFQRIVKEPAIESILNNILNIIDGNLKAITGIFNSVNLPIPIGFTDKDVNLNSKPLYTDTFITEYIKIAAKSALFSYAYALSVSARSDVRQFFTDRVNSAVKITNWIDEVMLNKGILIRSPYVPVEQRAEFVQKQSFINDLVGDKRPLNVMEISHLFANIETNRLGKILVTGFAQTSKTQKIKEYMTLGEDIARKHIDNLSELLKDEDVPIPEAWDAAVMESYEAPFSDKLMMFHITALISISLGAYGLAIANSSRSDISLTYSRLMVNLDKYAKDGAEIMIENSWLERLPQIVNKRELIKV